ncbi:Exocyst complex component S5, partial [Teratosphaeriaceae sp. CCFEE 6253]
MPVSAEQERRLLSHYKLTTLYPDTWPHQDDPDTSDDDATPPTPTQRNGARPVRAPSATFRAIDRHASLRSAAAPPDPSSIVQHDEPDPLGLHTATSVATELRQRGVPVDEDLTLRNRFLLSSTTFSPALFLSEVHRDASTEDLLRGLGVLTRSIELKSASLKVLVESHFERFVRAKATIDSVYTEMRTQGAGEIADTSSSPAPPGAAVPPSPGRNARPQSRRTSRGQSNAHFRNTSGTTPWSPTLGSPALGGGGRTTTTARKNALTRESEYGVLGIKQPLQDAALKAEEVWGPALGGREKEAALKDVLETMEAQREVFRLGSTVHEAVGKNDLETVVNCWNAANEAAEHARHIAESSRRSGEPLSDADARVVLLTAQSYASVVSQLEALKRTLWRQLKGGHHHHHQSRHHHAAAGANGSVNLAEAEVEREQHIELIAVLLQLGVDENPVWEWLNSWALYLKDRIARAFERSRVEIEIARRRLAVHAPADGRALARYLRSASSAETSLVVVGKGGGGEVDSPAALAFWEKVLAALRALLSPDGGLVGEVVEFWSTTQSFIDNRAQTAFPPSIPGDQLELEPDDVASLRAGALDLVAQVRELTRAFFADAPVEDLSELYSPIPPTPITPDSANGLRAGGRSLTFEAAGAVPPLSPARGEAWEGYAFWPPGGNALSGSAYLVKITGLVGQSCAALAGLSVVRQTPGAGGVEGLKGLVGVVRERSVLVLCAAWGVDAG